MKYELLAVIASLFDAECDRRKSELDLLREKLCDAREKLDLAPEDAELQKKVELAQNFYDKVREKYGKIVCAREDFESHDFR